MRATVLTYLHSYFINTVYSVYKITAGTRKMNTWCVAAPLCLSVQSYADGNLTLENKGEDGKGKCPFDPFQRYASVMFGK